MRASTILLNFVLWPVMQMGLARIFVMLPEAWFQQPATASGAGRGEVNFYRRALMIRRWKRWLPDGEGWVGGVFSKKSLRGASREHLGQFVTESRRGEATHWSAIACSLAFFLWNPVFTWPGLLFLAVALNGPCIAAQRYNRAMLLRWLRRP